MNDPIEQRFGELDTQESGVQQRQAALYARQKAGNEAYDADVRPLESSLQADIAQPLPKAQHAEFPKVPDPQSTVNAKDYEGLSYALIGMALIGGAASHGNWLGVSSSLNGALKGFMEGNQQQAKEQWDKYQKEFEAAKSREQQFDKEYDQILKDRNLTINEKLQQLRIKATQHGRQDVALAAEQKSIDAIERQIQAGRTQLTNTLERAREFNTRIETAARNRASGGGVKGSPQTEEGRKLAAEVMASGGNVSFFGGKGQLFDTLAQEGYTASDIVGGKVDLAAATTAKRNATNRLQAVDRLTSSVTSLESKVSNLARRAGNSNIPASNATINWVKQNLGDGQLQELKTLMSSVGRQYTEAVTMPGSNAQMHATAQEWSEGLLNPNMSMGQIQGSIRAMNAEIQATHSALQKQVSSATEGLGGGPAHKPAAGGQPVPLDDYLKSQGF